MSRASNPDYGDRRLSIWRANLRDRRAGRHPRANARMGYLRPPLEEGRVIWIKAGASADSVRLAVELLGAIRGRRRDARLALTFEEDYPQILEPRVRGLRRIGLGFGPCDLPRVVRRTLDRLQPVGIILVDSEPSPNLLAEAQARGLHRICFNTRPPVDGISVDAAYPRDPEQAGAWSAAGAATHLAEAADPLSLFVETQMDTTLKTLVAGGRELDLWYWQAPRGQWPVLREAWQASAPAVDGVLFLSDPDLPEMPDAAKETGGDLRVSTWDRSPIEPGSVVVVDDIRWLPAVASAATAIHLADSDRHTLWQALAGGTPTSASPELIGRFPWLAEALDSLENVEAVLTSWREAREDPMASRRRGDACRKAVWQERRRLQAVLDEFLQRTFDW